jgi:cobalt-zinc-cadmium resistance protein CzcA
VELSQRTDLVECTLHTVETNLVETNLVEGGLLVVAGLRLLGNIRGGLIVAVAIPLSMLFAVTRMVAAGLSSNMPALVAALDFLS